MYCDCNLCFWELLVTYHLDDVLHTWSQFKIHRPPLLNWVGFEVPKFLSSHGNCRDLPHFWAMFVSFRHFLLTIWAAVGLDQLVPPFHGWVHRTLGSLWSEQVGQRLVRWGAGPKDVPKFGFLDFDLLSMCRNLTAYYGYIRYMMYI